MRYRIKAASPHRFTGFFTVFFWLLLPLFSASASYAETLPAPQSEVLLKITGNLTNPNVGDQLHLDKNMLESLPAVTLSTHTVWDEGLQTFTGVRLSVLFEAAGAEPDIFIAKGLDDYQFTVDGLEVWKYPIIVAYKHNGEYISVRKLGPLRIMFPFDEYPDLTTEINKARSVWQLLELELN